MKAVPTFERYGGFRQVQPLTPAEQLYDDTCRSIDALERQVAEQPISAFTVAEFIWFSQFVLKIFMQVSQEQLEKQRSEVSALLAAVKTRVAAEKNQEVPK